MACGRQNGGAGGLGGGSSVDAFGRLRVSENHLLLSSQLNYDLLPLVWETELTGGGTITHLPAKASAQLTVGAASGDKVVRQTKRYWLYRAGQGQQIMLTFAEGDQVANVRKRAGYFDDNDGIFFEVTGTDLAVVLRTSTGGGVSESRIPQSAWSDRLDGTGPSTKTLDVTKAQILAIDFQWLGVGTVRVGFDMGDRVVYVHTFVNPNANDTVYMRSGSLPVRYEIENTAASAGAVFHQICSSVVREGGMEENGYLATAMSALSTQAATSTPKSMVSIRLRSSHIRAFLSLVQVELLNESNAKLRWQAILNPTLTGAHAWSNTGQASEVSLSMLNYTAGTGHVIGGGFVSSQGNSKGEFTSDIGANSVLGVAANKAGTSDILSLVVASDSAIGQTLSAGLQYIEMF
jgi:hypothetical protein